MIQRRHFHDQNRLAEVMCAVGALVEVSTNLPRAADVSEYLGYDATELLVHLARKGLVTAYGPVHDSWFDLSAAGRQAAVRHCRRRVA